MNFIDKVWQQAKENHSRIVLPEGIEPRTLKAADIILKEDLAEVILLGDKEEILAFAHQEQLEYVISKAQIINPDSHAKIDEYATIIYEIRKNKGMTLEKARKLVKDPLYLAATMIKAGDADGEVAGALNTTGDVLRPGFQIVKTLPGVKSVSGVFVMMLQDNEFGDNGTLLFADCAVNPDPDEDMLAEIAVTTADTARDLLEMDPRVAMLSFSTKGSASHPAVDKVQNAFAKAKKMRPDLKIDGEMQLDAAIVPSVASSKAPDSPLKGNANILIFPSLEAGNIAYKLVQRLAHADAFGPVLQGMAAPINDLSRGCFVKDIVNLVAITACQAAKSKKRTNCRTQAVN